MGCLSRFLVIGAFATQMLASAFALLVLGSAGVLGEAAIINANDALILLVLIGLNLLATVVIAIRLWSSGKEKKRMSQELASYQASRSGSGMGPNPR